MNVTAFNEDESNIDDREDVEDSESSQSTPASSQQVYSPPPIRGKIQPGKRCYKESHIEEKLLEITEKPETKLDEVEMFCLSITSTLKKIKDPQKKEYTKLQLQQCVYNSLYGQEPSNQQRNQHSMPPGMIPNSNSNFTFDGTNYTNYLQDTWHTLYHTTVHHSTVIKLGIETKCLFQFTQFGTCGGLSRSHNWLKVILIARRPDN